MRIDREVDFTQFVMPKSAAGTAEIKEFQPFLVKSIDKESRVISALASSGAIDRDNEIVEPAALKKVMPGYMRNPIILASHTHRLDDGRSPVIGKVVDYRFDKKGLWIDVEFAPTSLGEEYFQLYKNKFMRGFSIGFGTLKTDRRNIDGRSVLVHTELRELYEISACAIPCNPEALSKARSFVQQKKLEREKQKILNDDDTFCDLLERFEELSYEYIDPFGNIPADSRLWEKFTQAEMVVLKDFEESCKGFGFDEDFIHENDLCCEIDDEADALDGKLFDALEAKSEACTLSGAIRQRDRELIKAFGSERLFRKYVKYSELKKSGYSISTFSGPYGSKSGLNFSQEEVELFELIEKEGIKAAIEQVNETLTVATKTVSFAELVGGKR